MIKHLLIIVLIGGGIYYYWTTRPVTHGPGIVAPNTPVQETTFNSKKISYKDFILTPRANFKLEARVLSTKGYYFDKYSELTPFDVVFGWGPMSNETNLESLMVRQSDRSFYWEMARPPLEQQKMWQHAANMHLIGSTQKIRDKISSLRQGQVVKMKGVLVNVNSPDGWKLKTSLTRKDIGENSSEVVWIKSLTIL
ncbi:hypothetical protein [Fodinibius saliphilus]|uniref:hypothetical protein n=1 Tax=Fodinibius saliphilus TaxID=1920650 RepID=UPI0011089590|nr:hypothetical protein [Fodinibius saliphilus]